MVTQALKKVFGTKNDREVKKLWPFVEQINGFYEQYNQLSDAELQAKTDEFKQRLADKLFVFD